MNRSKLLIVINVAIAVCFVMSMVGAVQAQPAGDIERLVLQKHDLSVPGREGVLLMLVLPPGAEEPNHTHPADAFAYVQEGSLSLSVEGKPTVTLKPGDTFFVEAGQPHSFKNEGTSPTKLLVTLFAEKGKPISTGTR